MKTLKVVTNRISDYKPFDVISFSVLGTDFLVPPVLYVQISQSLYADKIRQLADSVRK